MVNYSCVVVIPKTVVMVHNVRRYTTPKNSKHNEHLDVVVILDNDKSSIDAMRCREFESLVPESAKHHQVRTKIFSPDSRCVLKANSEFHLRMKQLELDVPYSWPYFVAKSSFGQSIRRCAP